MRTPIAALLVALFVTTSTSMAALSPVDALGFCPINEDLGGDVVTPKPPPADPT